MIERLSDIPNGPLGSEQPGSPEQPDALDVSVDQIAARLRQRDLFDADRILDEPFLSDDMADEPNLDEDLTPEERAEIIESRMIAEAVTRERQAEQLKTYGKTDAELEAEADAWLNEAGFDDLVEGK